IDALAKELGVSVTPVREALHYLAAQGLVSIEPHRGFLVKKWSKKEIEDLLSLRCYLEKLAVRLFIERGYDKNIEALREKVREMKVIFESRDIGRMEKCNIEFHTAIVRGSGNDELRKVIDSLADKLHRVRIFSISFPGRFEKSFKEHIRIYEAIERKNIVLAEKRVEEHIDSILKALLKRFEKGSV
ncbi:MAG: GntR family transcriptional regulator, partial [Synergistetes bacterium]|nr:GntR family transcriptional regulator [Synergistota bacterium]